MLKPLTIVTFAWGGARPIYGPWHAANMKRQCAKHLTIPHRFVCVTDNVPAMEAAGIEAFPLWKVPPVQATQKHWLFNYVRLGLFSREHGGQIGERLLSIDLDAIIRSNIDDLVSDPAPFKILSLKSRVQLQGGLFLIEPGSVTPDPWVVLHNDPTIIERSRKWVGSDQGVLSELFYGDVPTWDEDDGIIINRLEWPGWRIFFRTGARKCWAPNAPERDIYFAESGVFTPPPAIVRSPLMERGPLATRAPHLTRVRRYLVRR